MKKHIRNCEPVSISFEKEVILYLELRCKKENISKSEFVNNLVKKVVMSEYEYYRSLAKQASADHYKYKQLMDSAPDRPIFEVASTGG